MRRAFPKINADEQKFNRNRHHLDFWAKRIGSFWEILSEASTRKAAGQVAATAKFLDWVILPNLPMAGLDLGNGSRLVGRDQPVKSMVAIDTSPRQVQARMKTNMVANFSTSRCQAMFMTPHLCG